LSTWQRTVRGRYIPVALAIVLALSAGFMLGLKHGRSTEYFVAKIDRLAEENTKGCVVTTEGVRYCGAIIEGASTVSANLKVGMPVTVELGRIDVKKDEGAYELLVLIVNSCGEGARLNCE
jgi:hypothetical protein